MTDSKALPIALMKEYGVSQPRFVEETGIASIWKVRRSNGEFAALKTYKKPHMGNEAPGFAYLEALEGRGAAFVFERNAHSALIEWLDGPSLGDLARARQDKKATIELVAVANKIHMVRGRVVSVLPSLEDWFEALFFCQFSPDCASLPRRNIEKCQRIARDLLGSQRDIRPLHGDLHHDNIKLGSRGYCAFDAKGVVGERTYELANAFRNPKGIPDILRDVERIRYLRTVWAEQFCVDPHRLMQWAVVKSALSIVWRCPDKIGSDPEFDLLDILVSIAETKAN
ncbi:MAG: aminoglycoside phosphotransferase family protein [Litoreibacter sp.]